MLTWISGVAAVFIDGLYFVVIQKLILVHKWNISEFGFLFGLRLAIEVNLWLLVFLNGVLVLIDEIWALELGGDIVHVQILVLEGVIVFSNVHDLN